MKYKHILTTLTRQQVISSLKPEKYLIRLLFYNLLIISHELFLPLAKNKLKGKTARDKIEIGKFQNC